MKKYLCTICGHIYDEEAGDEKTKIPEKTTFESLPEKWTCPICGAAKFEFRELTAPKTQKPPKTHPLSTAGIAVLKDSAICSSLAKGCEKQYKNDEAAIYHSLSKELKESVPKMEGASFSALHQRAGQEIASLIPTTKRVAENHHDRGALRAVTWAEKVTRIHHSLLERHAAEGPALLKDKTVFLCPVCGFIFIAEKAPSKCPVCSVPEWKFEIVEA
ncbi:MAG: rubredoxin [Methanocorpusculum parvum]|nr:rubredoxin [Methanocorpusculum parvum]